MTINVTGDEVIEAMEKYSAGMISGKDLALRDKARGYMLEARQLYAEGDLDGAYKLQQEVVEYLVG